MARERRVGDVVDARVERDLAFALRAHGGLDRCEHLGVGERQRAHVVAREKEEVERCVPDRERLREEALADEPAGLRAGRHGEERAAVVRDVLVERVVAAEPLLQRDERCRGRAW